MEKQTENMMDDIQVKHLQRLDFGQLACFLYQKTCSVLINVFFF